MIKNKIDPNDPSNVDLMERIAESRNKSVPPPVDDDGNNVDPSALRHIGTNGG